jgi:ThiF family
VQLAARLAAEPARVTDPARPDAFRARWGTAVPDHVARHITDCDFIFLAADTMLARSVVNQIAYQYLIPTLQAGSKPVIHKETGEVLDVFAVVRTLGTAPGCLACNELIDPARLAEESLGDATQVANQRYVDDPDVHAPSVITLNAMAAGWAANDFMQYMVGFGRPVGGFRILRTNPVNADAPHVTVQEPDCDPSCYICGTAPHTVRARGDRSELPTRINSTGRRS